MQQALCWEGHATVQTDTGLDLEETSTEPRISTLSQGPVWLCREKPP
jgi:hypothetical protein